MPQTPVQEQVKTYSELAELQVWTARDNTLDAMEKLYGEIDHRSREGIVLCFALAKIYDQLGETEQCFSLLVEGNRNHQTGKTDTIEDARATINLVQQVFTRQSIQQLSPVDHRKLIFIVGMPRSGTTLVEQILASHSQVYGGGELKMMGQWCFGYLKLYKEYGQKASLDNYLPQLQEHYLRGIGQLSDLPVITDKMPVNFLWIGFILSVFPNARIIHTMRKPMAVCWSIFRTPFAGTSNGYSCDLQDIAEFYGLYRQHMNFWKTRYPDTFHEICYERLTEDQRQETAELLEYCDLPWEDSCLEFYRNTREVRTVSKEQVRRPMYQGSSDAWKRYERFLLPLKESLARYSGANITSEVSD